MPLSAGETFAGYRIVHLLGSGGMGEVYLAEITCNRCARHASAVATVDLLR